jgi:hypothetical protein
MPEGVLRGLTADLDLSPQDAFGYLWFYETHPKTWRTP